MRFGKIHFLLSAHLIVAQFLFFPAAANPPVSGWNLFSSVKFVPKFVKEYNENFLFPQFNAGIKAQAGKEITLQGHYLPVELEDKNSIILSKFPFSACFFCGLAGPESVAEIIFDAKAPKLKSDQVIIIKGILELNDTDINHMNFIIKHATIIPK